MARKRTSGPMYNFTFKNTDGLWVKVTTLTHQDPSKPKIVLLPMIHVADNSYFEEMYYEKFCCDVVLLEGVVHPIGSLANTFYKAFAALRNVGARAQYEWSSQTGLRDSGWGTCDVQWHHPKESAPLECTVYQEYPETDPAQMRRAIRFVRADVTAKMAREALRTLPWWTYVVVPFVMLSALVTLRFKTRVAIIDELFANRHSTQGDGKSAADRAWNVFWKFASETRDDRLASVLFDELKSPLNAGKTIGVKFGAAHMYPLIIKLRRRLGYKITEKRAVLAWAIDPKLQAASPNNCYGVAKEKYARIIWEPAMKREANQNLWEAKLPDHAGQREWRLAKGTPQVHVKGFRTRGSAKIASSG
jgi:hypothetical protein